MEKYKPGEENIDSDAELISDSKKIAIDIIDDMPAPDAPADDYEAAMWMVFGPPVVADLFDLYAEAAKKINDKNKLKEVCIEISLERRRRKHEAMTAYLKNPNYVRLIDGDFKERKSRFETLVEWIAVEKAIDETVNDNADRLAQTAESLADEDIDELIDAFRGLIFKGDKE